MSLSSIRSATIVTIRIALIAVPLTFVGWLCWIYVEGRKEEKNRAVLEEFNATSEALLRDTNKRLKEGIPVGDTTDQAAQLKEAMGRAAANMTGEDALAVRAGERFMGSMQPYVARYDKAFSTLQARGGINPKTLTSREEIEERLSMVKEFETANQELLKFNESFEAQFRAELSKVNFPAGKLDAATWAFVRAAHVDTMTEIRGADAELCASMRGYLETLLSEWGKWKIEEGAVTFENTAAADTFNGHREKVREISAREERLQQRFLREQENARKASQRAAIAVPQ